NPTLYRSCPGPAAWHGAHQCSYTALPRSRSGASCADAPRAASPSPAPARTAKVEPRRPISRLLPEVLRPHAVAAGGENAVRIDGVLDLLPQSAQRMIVERVRVRDRVLEHGRRTVLRPAVLRCELDPALERRSDLAVLLGVLRHRE